MCSELSWCAGSQCEWRHGHSGSSVTLLVCIEDRGHALHSPPCTPIHIHTPRPLPQVMISIACSLLSAAILIPTMVSTVGVWGLVKFWLMPWLGYHFWMSCFTVVHHTAPHISFQPVDKWNAAKAQLSGTVHCDYPAWWVTEGLQGIAVCAGAKLWIGHRAWLACIGCAAPGMGGMGCGEIDCTRWCALL